MISDRSQPALDLRSFKHISQFTTEAHGEIPQFLNGDRTAATLVDGRAIGPEEWVEAHRARALESAYLVRPSNGAAIDFHGYTLDGRYLQAQNASCCILDGASQTYLAEHSCPLDFFSRHESALTTFRVASISGRPNLHWEDLCRIFVVRVR